MGLLLRPGPVVSVTRRPRAEPQVRGTRPLGGSVTPRSQGRRNAGGVGKPLGRAISGGDHRPGLHSTDASPTNEMRPDWLRRQSRPDVAPPATSVLDSGCHITDRARSRRAT
ncbi:hypothetical protein GCM10009872_62540 [Actinopolymorpha rutila]